MIFKFKVFIKSVAITSQPTNMLFGNLNCRKTFNFLSICRWGSRVLKLV